MLQDNQPILGHEGESPTALLVELAIMKWTKSIQGYIFFAGSYPGTQRRNDDEKKTEDNTGRYLVGGDRYRDGA